jgi:chromosome segregation ATPase
MAHPDSHSTGDTEREALATLIARFSADRDTLAAGAQRAEAAVRELAARLDATVARLADAAPARELGALRGDVGQLAALVEALRHEVVQLRGSLNGPRDDASAVGTAAVVGAVEEMRAELRRAGIEIAEQAARHAERAAGGVAEATAEAHRTLAAALLEAQAQWSNSLEDLQRLVVAGSDRATQALAQSADLERRWRDLEGVRSTLGPLRDEVLRRVDETEARLGVRLDSIIAGVEAETAAVRDTLWDRVTGGEQRLQDAEAVLAAMRIEVPQHAARALEGIAALQVELAELRDGLGATEMRLGGLEARRAPRGGLGGVVECVRDEIVAAVMMVVSVGAVIGRLTLSLVR